MTRKCHILGKWTDTAMSVAAMYDARSIRVLDLSLSSRLLFAIISIEQNSSWEGDGPHISGLLKNRIFYYHVEKKSRVFSIPSQMNPVHTVTSYFFKCHVPIGHTRHLNPSHLKSFRLIFLNEFLIKKRCLIFKAQNTLHFRLLESLQRMYWK